jgi:hypothetical protein
MQPQLDSSQSIKSEMMATLALCIGWTALCCPAAVHASSAAPLDWIVGTWLGKFNGKVGAFYRNILFFKTAN